MKDEYATEQESQMALVPDTRTPAQKKLDKMLEDRGAWEIGSNHFTVLYQITIDMIEGRL